MKSHVRLLVNYTYRYNYFKRFPSSRIVLSASSDYFLKMFTSSFKEKQSEEVTIMNVEADDFQNLIDVCYTGKIYSNFPSLFHTYETVSGRLVERAIWSNGTLRRN